MWVLEERRRELCKSRKKQKHFAQYNLSGAFSVSLNINNLFEAVGLTEAEEAKAATPNTIVRARSIQGRSTTLTLKYEF